MIGHRFRSIMADIRRTCLAESDSGFYSVCVYVYICVCHDSNVVLAVCFHTVICKCFISHHVDFQEVNSSVDELLHYLYFSETSLKV